MNQTEQNSFTKQIEREKERLQKEGVRLEVMQAFARKIDHIFEKAWKEIATYVDKLGEEHHLSTEELVLMSIILGEIEEKHIRTSGNTQIAK